MSTTKASATIPVTESLQLVIDTSDTVHAFSHTLQGGCGLRLAPSGRIPADQLKDRSKPFLGQLIHQMV